MRKRKLITRILTVCTVFALCITCFSQTSVYNIKVEASTLSDLQAKKKANDAKLKQINQKISSTKNDQKKEKEYQENVSEQITVTEENIRVILEEIDTLEKNIAALNESIAQQEADIQKGMDEFKERLRVMYMSGNDSMASVLVGSADFYDLLSRMEFVKRIAKSDDQMIDDLNDQLLKLNNDKTALEADKAQNEQSKAQLEQNKSQLNDAYSKSAATIADQQKEIQDYQKNKAEIDKVDEQIEQAIQDEIKRLASLNDKYVGGEYMWPAPGYTYISSGYGMRWGRMHKGIDIAGSGIYGKKIVAANAGKVIVAFTNDSKGYSYGKYVMIDHGGGNVTLYGHCSKLNVSVGQYVNKGDTIAFVGSTGNSTGPHLHFEIRRNGSTVNPMNYFK